MVLPSFLTGPIWKIATIGAGVVSLVLVALLMSSYFERQDLLKQRAALELRINDPKTGYVAQLAQATTNVATLKVAVERQTKQLKDFEAASNAQLKATEAQLKVAQEQTRVSQLKLNRFLATKPQGATLEDRVRDIDARALAELIK